jgi:DNA-binding response OmpR family regulator
MMPHLDGLGFLHEFRRRHGLDACAIFIMSAVSTAVQHAEAAGVAGAFVKPFDLDELMDTVSRLIGNCPPTSMRQPDERHPA